MTELDVEALYMKIVSMRCEHGLAYDVEPRVYPGDWDRSWYELDRLRDSLRIRPCTHVLHPDA